MLQAWLQVPYALRALAGLATGALAGWALGPAANDWFGPLGTVYVILLKLIALPLVALGAMHAVAALRGRKSIAALGGRTLLWFAITAALAVGIGFAVGAWLQPGRGLGMLTVAADFSVHETPSPWQMLSNVVLRDPLTVLVEGKILQGLVFAVLAGVVLAGLGERSAGARRLVDKAGGWMRAISRWVLELTPLGVFGLIAALVGAYGFEVLLPLKDFVLALYLACALHIVVVYGGLLAAHGLNPARFFRGAGPTMLIAFTASSSFASMPASLRSLQKLGVDRDYAALALPLGVNIKLDGCGAIYPALTSLFVAQYFGLELAPAQYLAILLASILGSFGSAGVPGGPATAVTTLVLGAAGLPLEGLGYLVAIDRVLDMMRTMTNVTGQMLVPTLVARETGLLDRTRYDGATGNIGLEGDDDRRER